MHKDKARTINQATADTGLLGGLRRAAKATGATIAAAMLALAPAAAQDVESFDPDEAFESVDQAAANSSAIDADLVDPGLREAPGTIEADVREVSEPVRVPSQTGFDSEFADYSSGYDAADAAATQAGEPVPEWSDPLPGEQVAGTEQDPRTYGQDDLIGAAEGVFGKGAQGLAGLIEDLLRDQGEPNGYIVGREAGGAFIFGARYGSGTLHHKIEGERKVYWTGPSLGFDAGANAANTFVLVYNLYDTQDIFRRYPAGEGQAYFVGGLHASYMRRGDVVLIPIRMGAGLRLGVNAGYMRFSEKQRWLPF